MGSLMRVKNGYFLYLLNVLLFEAAREIYIDLLVNTEYKEIKSGIYICNRKQVRTHIWVSWKICGKWYRRFHLPYPWLLRRTKRGDGKKITARETETKTVTVM